MTRRVTRRRFLGLGAAAAGVAALGGRVLPQTKEPQPGAGQSPVPGAAAPPASFPPLPDPLPGTFHLSRIEAAREGMARTNVSHLIEVPGPDLFYFTGLQLQRADRFSGLVLPASGPPVLVCPAADRAIVQAGPVPLEESVFYDVKDEPVGLTSKLLKRGKATLVALGGRIWYEEFVPLHEDLPRLTFVVSHAFTQEPRRIKTPDEVRLIEAAARIARDAVETTLREIREGMREMDIALMVGDRIRARGAEAEGTVVSGTRSAVPRLPTSDRRIGAGDPVILSFGARVHGYWASVSRTAVVGKATGRMKLIQETIRDAQGFALEKAHPGQPAGGVDQIMRATLGGRGFLKQVLHGSGAGCGLEMAEPPHISPGYLAPLSAGEVFTLGQGVYTPGEYGIRQHDMALVTSGEARWITTPAAELPEL